MPVAEKNPAVVVFSRLISASQSFLASGKFLVSFSILVIGIAVSVASYWAVKANVEKEARLRFDRQASDAHHNIEARVRSYIDVMYSLGTLFRTFHDVPRAQFHSYVTGLDLERRFPGFQNLNYASQIPRAEKADLERRIRNDKSLNPSGYPNFQITPPGDRDYYHPIIYLEPMEGNEVSFGRDIAGVDASRKAPLEQMRDTGELFSSGRLIVIDGANRHVGLSMRLPVYRSGMPLETVEQRRTAFIGSLGAGYRVKELIRGVLDEATLTYMRFKIYDAGPAQNYAQYIGSGATETLLFDSQEFLSEKDATSRDMEPVSTFTTVLPLIVASRTWEIHFSAPQAPIIGVSSKTLPWAVLGGGILISLLLYGIAHSLASSRSRAVALANEITQDLQISEASLAEAQRIARLGNWALKTQPEGALAQAMTWSDQMFRIFGITPGQVTPSYQELMVRTHEKDKSSLENALRETVLSKGGLEIEHRIIWPDGAVRWVHTIIRSIENASGAILQGTCRDITENKLTSIRLEVEHSVTQLAASASTGDGFLSEVLRITCERMEWACGLYWEGSKDGSAFSCSETWCLNESTLRSFTEHCRRLSFSESKITSHPNPTIQLVPDLDKGRLVGSEAHAKAGLKCSIIVPLQVSQSLVSVIEFFSRQPIELDQGLCQLLESISNQVSQFIERKRAEEALRFIAAHDSLTQLPNRNMFNDRLRRAVGHAARYQRGIAVLFVDIDRFKLLNDTLGHSAGDAMLVACAKRLTESVRDSDLVARLGGDEFVVMLENLSAARDAIVVAQKILNGLSRPFMIERRELVITASVGIATFPDDGLDAGTLLKNADIAMYRAKEQGRNNYQFYSAQMNKHSFERLAMETSMRRAVERKEFQLYYQPKVDLQTEAITGVEALVRWNHPDWGMISPVQFIPLAEETGLIVQIGEWVLETACHQIKKWCDQGLPPIRMAVNLSPRQFAQESLLKDIAAVIARSGASAETLELELTESLVMQQPEHAAQTLRRLKAMGISIAIDDFGTGYSSLAYLKRFPIDFIKIDRSFIKDVPADPDDIAITKGVIALGHGLRLKVVAEGVETEEQRQFLKSNECDEIQGYLYSKPLPESEMTPMLKAHFRRPGLRVVDKQKRA